MRNVTIVFSAAVIGASLAIAGCGHKLIAAKGENTVAIYPDEETYIKVERMKKQGGIPGVLGGLGENFVARQVDDKTAVKIVSSDTEGSKVIVLDGPAKGFTGFVPTQNVD